MGNPNETVRTNLRAIRKERGYSQEELSDRCDFAPRNVGALERGEKSLTAEDLLRFAVELETRVSDFFVNNGQPEEHARSVDRQPYDLGSLIENSDDEEPDADLGSLFDTSHDLLVLLDEDGCVLEANGRYESLSGSDLEANRGDPFWECPIWFGANQRRMKYLIDEAREGQFHREVLPVRTTKGSTRPMTVSICPIRSDVDDVLQFLVEASFC